jgi:hypothetical protein
LCGSSAGCTLANIALILLILLGISLSFTRFAAIFALKIEQPSLDVHAAIETSRARVQLRHSEPCAIVRRSCRAMRSRVTCQRAVGANDAVAGNDLGRRGR